VDNSALPSQSIGLSAADGDFSELIFQTEEGEGFEIGMQGRSLDEYEYAAARRWWSLDTMFNVAQGRQVFV